MTEKEFLRAVKGADRRFFKMAADRAADPQAFAAKYGAGGTRKMKSAEKKHHRKLAWGVVLAAALVGGGGIAAAVAMRGGFGIVSEESRDMRSMVEEQHAEALSLSLTDQEWNSMQAQPDYQQPSDSWAFPAESGWYHSYTEDCVPSDGELSEEFRNAQDALYGGRIYMQNGMKIIRFCDRDTHEDVPLCARANCLHDGSEYCEATSAYYDHSELVCCDGVIYASAIKRDPNNMKDRGTAVLLSYAPDGTGITELCTFGEQYLDVYAMPVVHRGYVFCAFAKYHPLEYDAEGVMTNYDTGYAILAYETATGKTQEIYSCMPKEGTGIGGSSAPLNVLTAGGDYLFHSIGNTVWQLADKQGIYALNLRTGEHTMLVEKTTAFSVHGSKVYYADWDSKPRKVMMLDAATGERTVLFEGTLGDFVTDGEYIYTAAADYSKEHAGYTVQVLDMTGKIISSLAVPDKATVNQIKVCGDTVCVLTSGVLAEYNGHMAETYGIIAKDAAVLSCSREALLAGSAEWEQACTLVKMHEIDMEAWRAEHPEPGN